MTIHWKALEEHFLIVHVPLFFDSPISGRGKMHVLYFSQKNISPQRVKTSTEIFADKIFFEQRIKIQRIFQCFQGLEEGFPNFKDFQGGDHRRSQDLQREGLFVKNSRFSR
jgi:hypothetical protein